MLYEVKYWFGILRKIGMKIQGDILFILEYSLETAFHIWPFVVPWKNVFLQQVPFLFLLINRGLICEPRFSYQIKMSCCFSLRWKCPLNISEMVCAVLFCFYKQKANSAEIQKPKSSWFWLYSLETVTVNSLGSILPYLFISLLIFKYICLSIGSHSVYTVFCRWLFIHGHLPKPVCCRSPLLFLTCTDYSLTWMHHILLYQPVSIYLVVSGLSSSVVAD